MSYSSEIYSGLIQLGIEPVLADQAAQTYSTLDLAIDGIFNGSEGGIHQSESRQRDDQQTQQAIQQSLDSIDDQPIQQTSPNRPTLERGMGPLCFRSSSPHLSILSAYFNAIQSIQTFQIAFNQINNLASPNKTDPPNPSFYSLQTVQLIGQVVFNQSSVADQVIEIDSISQAIKVEPINFQHSNNNMDQVNSIHHKLVNSINHFLPEATNSESGSTPDWFVASGKSVPTGSSPAVDSDHQSFSWRVVKVQLDSSLGDRLSIYDALDHQLVSSDRLSLFTNQPRSLVFQFDQAAQSRSSQVILSKQISLARYSCHKLDSIARTRLKLDQLSEQISSLKHQTEQLSNTQPINQAIEYLTNHSANPNKLDTELTALVRAAEDVSGQLGEQLTQAIDQRDNAFDQIESETDEGDYHLTSFIVRNGLNGRSSSFAVVLGEDGSYYKMDDRLGSLVDLDSAIDDKTGLILGAGIAFAFYQITEPSTLVLRGGVNSDQGSSDEEDEEGLDEDEVELGTLVRIEEGHKFDVDYGVGKVGGQPVWLDPSNPIEYKQVECEVCHQTMSFLLQLNSPDDSRTFAQARTLYLFACRTTTCQFNTKLWRTQMGSPNPFFPHTPQTKANRAQFESTLNKVTGLGGAGGDGLVEPVVWPEYEIECEEEPYEESYLPDIPHNPINDQIDGDDQNAPDTAVGVDRTFLEFQARLSRVPEQVVRFYRLPGVESPQALLVSNQPLDSAPDCTLCGAKREVEFQVVATLLSFLKDDNLQFDSLIVYTCSNNCDPSSFKPGHAGWAEEVVVQQSYDQAGVEFGNQPEI